jgi:hypothetical protein
MTLAPQPQMHMIKMGSGKGVEHWAVRDDAGLMRQLISTPESNRLTDSPPAPCWSCWLGP